MNKICFSVVLVVLLSLVGCGGNPSDGIASNGGRGPSGPAGATGPIGEQGLTGAQGATGAQGPAGKDGAQGPAGTQGMTGPVGAAGPEGPMGSAGTTGATGPAGAAGPKGATGTTGPTGPAGATSPLMGKGSLYTVTNSFTTGGGTPAGGISYCTSTKDIVLTGSCAISADVLGVMMTQIGPISPTDTTTQSAWGCAWINDSSTMMFTTVTAVCLSIP